MGFVAYARDQWNDQDCWRPREFVCQKQGQKEQENTEEEYSMFIAGGNVNYPGSSASVEVWSPKNGTQCSLVSNMPENRFAGTMNGFVYCGGNAQSEDPNNCLVYKPSSNSWSKHEYGGPGRWYHTSAMIGDVIYLIGGEAGTAQRTTRKIWFDSNGDFQSEKGFNLGKPNIV